jgi:hypothetical protein
MRTFQRVSRFIRPEVGLPVLAGLALAGLFALALGCGGADKGSASTAPAIKTRLPDIPVPAGFEFKANDSSDRLVTGKRAVQHVYGGSAPVAKVAEFYRREMVPLGWKLVEENFNAGIQRFLFDKGSETCYISIYDDWGTKVQINLYPSSYTPASPAPMAAPSIGQPKK